jgi:hypothetical protein
MEPADGDLQDDVIKSRLTEWLDTDVSEWRALALSINILLDNFHLYCLFIIELMRSTKMGKEKP